MKKIIAIVFSLICVLQSCQESEQAPKTEGKTKIVCTTGMLKDLAINLLPSKYEVDALMGPGVDPHYYKASQGDLVNLQKADLIIYNGLHLEGKMGDILQKLAKRKEVWSAELALVDADIRKTGEFASGQDPHFWFDVLIWKKVASVMSLKLQNQFPEDKIQIEKNTSAYLQKLNDLDKEIRTKLTQVPENRRVLYTAHDAFAYFGRRYNIEVLALQGLSTSTEFGLKDVQNTVNTLVERQIPAIFVESSVSPKAIQSVVEQCQSLGFNLKIGGELFSDAMGDEGTPEGTYIGMLQHNTNTFVEAMKN